VERTDYPPYRREDVDGLGTFPPPPPPPDGKACCGGTDNCCNFVFNDLQAAGRYRGEKGERGPRVRRLWLGDLEKRANISLTDCLEKIICQKMYVK